MTEEELKEMRAKMFATPERDTGDPFENMADRVLGPAMREDDTLCAELWSALANLEWEHPELGVASYSFRSAGSMIAAVLGRGCYMDWYCSGPYATVSDRIAEALEGEGWHCREME